MCISEVGLVLLCDKRADDRSCGAGVHACGGSPDPPAFPHTLRWVFGTARPPRTLVAQRNQPYPRTRRPTWTSAAGLESRPTINPACSRMGHDWLLHKALVVVIAGMVLLCGCHRHKVSQALPPPTPAPTAPVASTPESAETGLASWYGHPYHGRASASGEIYDMEQMTAAHRTLAFGTMVRVHDLDNEKSVDVRINDRGPFVDGRIIDLSHAAARTIEMIGADADADWLRRR